LPIGGGNEIKQGGGAFEIELARDH
jgi:hypothetical protein